MSGACWRVTRHSVRLAPTGIALALIIASGCNKDPEAAYDGSLPKATLADALSVAPVAAAGREFVLDSDASRIVFVGSNLTTSQAGSFPDIQGSLKLPGNDITQGSAELVINVAALKTRVDGLTTHLKSAEFFDVASFPTAKFVTTKISPNTASGATHAVEGVLEIRGKKQLVTFPASIGINGDTATLNAKFLLNRQPFGVAYPGSPDNLIRDEVMLTFDLKARAK